MIEAKYIVLGHFAIEIIWIYKIINEMGLETKNIIFYSNNKMSISLTKNIKS